MKEWKYLIGSADDFIGAPEWATEKRVMEEDNQFWLQERKIGSKVQVVGSNTVDEVRYLPREGHDILIAQRTESFGNAIDLEFCKANPDHPDCKCKEEGKMAIGPLENKITLDDISFSKSLSSFMRDINIGIDGNHNIDVNNQQSKYNRPCKGITLDVYDVLQAFTVTNPATQHAIKKLLCAGLRGHKDKMQDLTEALKSIERAIELEKE